MSSTSLLLLIVAITSMASTASARSIINNTAKMLNGDDNEGGNQNLLVSMACNHTIYTQVCLSSLNSDPRTRSATDMQGIAEIALDLSIAYGVNAVASVHKMKSNYSSASNYVLGCLSDCLEEYYDAISNLNDSMEALKNKSYDTVNELVSGAMTDSDTCEDGFKEMADEGRRDDADQADDETTSPLTDTNQFFFQLCSNVLAITKVLV
ncbi:hypothetical protein Syun_026682 [Stephania yunnanensis]|uniref:Pectinesterase inhibitor domain-containing protein n=1 Tax=Stephania yunnanensis TaxID=152371 RepID=A0AAP0EWU6_9MAGN